MTPNPYGPNWSSPINLLIWLFFVIVFLIILVKVLIPLLILLVHSI